MKYFDDVTEEILARLEKTQKEFWNISRPTAEFMYNFIKSCGFKNVLEVGTSNGYSGIWLGKAVEATKGQLTTIEFWEKRFSIARENFIKCGISDRITIIQGSACDVLKDLPQDFKIDFAFIDANKKEYVDYFNLIHPHLADGGYIACDNVLSHKEKTQTFIDAINNHCDYENVILPLPAGLSLGRKINSNYINRKEKIC